MSFTFNTEYGYKAFLELARALRKTVKKKATIGRYLLAICLVILAAVRFGRVEEMDIATLIILIAVILMTLVLLFQDQIDAFYSKKNLPHGGKTVRDVFSDGGYDSFLGEEATSHKYSDIGFIAETENYFLLIFEEIPAQLLDKSTLSEGDTESFRRFISDKTDAEYKFVK